ncbi:MAG TPA: hypothetical protein VKW78_10745 [Terriglobales bacterium]|nr:hypothetical protein [Terriglobales bacterium]
MKGSAPIFLQIILQHGTHHDQPESGGRHRLATQVAMVASATNG